MRQYVQRGRLAVHPVLDIFIAERALPGTGISQETFWQGFAQIVAAFTPQNTALLRKRVQLQKEIDNYHSNNGSLEISKYKDFLTRIGYLVDQPQNVSITTTNVDKEIASKAGPQLVVPINNARYAINAVNARWGSLYDALYGSDLISQSGTLAAEKQYNPIRGEAVVEQAKSYLDTIIPLQHGSHKNVIQYAIKAQKKLCAHFADGTETELVNEECFIGFCGPSDSPTSYLFVHHGLHLEVQVDPNHAIGARDPAGVKDIVVEAAISTIMDCEDSVTAVDAEDKTQVYENWLGLMLGTLQADVRKNGAKLTRKMQPDRIYEGLNGETLVLPGRSLMFIRNVGHLMTSDAILFDQQPIYEGIMDGVITSLIAKHDLRRRGRFINSAAGSVYIVKPKMHGPEEVAFTNELFAAIETLLDMKPHTIKMGIMDEERRTSANLRACIAAASARVVFINTGFLDRTGDEIHTSMLAGAVAPKAELKRRPWIKAYETTNVAIGLQAGLSGRAQIGKGMWPIPDNMQAMMHEKGSHPQSGASTAWVPSPTAATLHALHYHDTDVFNVQKQLPKAPLYSLDQLLTIPLMNDKILSPEAIQQELDNNVQGILGYVVRWVHQGIGCSKVPDINHIGLMEDRATLRISSQHIANWLLHGIVNKEQVDASLRRLANLVDEQNADDPNYIPMLPDLHHSLGFQAARSLIFEGRTQPSGYTEPLLHDMRKKMKARQRTE